MSAPVKPGTPLAGAAGSAHFVVVDVVGNVPIKKGPLLGDRVSGFLRELRGYYTSARLTVVKVRNDNDIWPYSEGEWLDLDEPPNATKLSHGAEEGVQ